MYKSNFKTAMMLTLALAMTASVLFTACGKDEPSSKNSLSGTAWVDEDNQYIDTYYFTSDSKGTYNQYQKGLSAFDVPFSYVYNPPKITITMHYPSSDEDIEGTIDGDIMNLGMWGTYYKQDRNN